MPASFDNLFAIGSYFVPMIRLRRPRQAHPLNLREAGALHPLAILRFAVTGPGASAHQHVERKQSREAGSGFVRVQHKVRYNQPSLWRKRFKGSLQELLVLAGREHMADRRQQHQVILSGFERHRQHVSHASRDAVRESRLTNVVFGYRQHVRHIDDLRMKFWSSFGKGDGIRSRPSAEIEHRFGAIELHRLGYGSSPAPRINVHGRDKWLDRGIACLGRNVGALPDCIRKCRPALPQIRHV